VQQEARNFACSKNINSPDSPHNQNNNLVTGGRWSLFINTKVERDKADPKTWWWFKIPLKDGVKGHGTVLKLKFEKAAAAGIG